MHELSVAGNIFEIIRDEMANHPHAKISSVELEIGSLSGIEIESLRFALDMLPRDSQIKDALFHIKETDAMALCRSCGQHFGIRDFWDACPRCNSHDPEIISGREMKINSITIEED